MEWLNYHHLLYFWVVAKEGSIARATEELRLAQPTISGQIRRLEEALGERLFVRQGRNLALTEIGQVVFRYAEEIFALGRELQDAIKGAPIGRPMPFLVGVADVLPKLLTRRLLEPALELPVPVRLVCHEGKPDRLLAELAVHGLDIVLSDAPANPTLRVKTFSHLLGECDVVFLAAPALAAAHRKRFPESLKGAPLLLPTESSALRRSLDAWFTTHGIRPRIVGEGRCFITDGGIHPAPSVTVEEIQRQYHVRLVGTLEDVRERFYAISVERKLKHPAVLAMSQRARKGLFSG